MIQAKQIKDEAAAAIAKIVENDVWSDDYKLSMRGKINDDTIEKVKAVIEDMRPSMEALKAELQEPQANIDIGSVKLQNALQLVKMAGSGKIPDAIQKSIVEQLSEDVGALEVLLPMFSDSGMYSAAQIAEEKINAVIRDSRFVDQIDDVLYYATMSASPDGGIERAVSMAQSFAHTNGFEIAV